MLDSYQFFLFHEGSDLGLEDFSYLAFVFGRLLLGVLTCQRLLDWRLDINVEYLSIFGGCCYINSILEGPLEMIICLVASFTSLVLCSELPRVYMY